jgi:hypothetical protein
MVLVIMTHIYCEAAAKFCVVCYLDQKNVRFKGLNVYIQFVYR